MSPIEPFKRITSPGVTDLGRLFVTIDWDGKRLSMTGVEGPLANGDCRGSCGQTGMTQDSLVLADGFSLKQAGQLRRIWDRWHLNDMRSGCRHQREWGTLKPLELVELKWTAKYHTLSREAGAGNLSPDDYVVFAEKSRVTYPLAIDYPRPKHPDCWGELGESLIADGYLERGKVETKAAGWVYPSEHPEGLLTKPCSECGHEYGSAWLYEDVPDEVLEFLRGLPDNENETPERWRR